MKLIKILSVLFFLGVFLFFSNEHALALDPYRPRCVAINGTFYANSSWKGGKIMIGCSGDDGGYYRERGYDEAYIKAHACLGETQFVQPGKSFRLTKCSCFGSDKGCLRVGKQLTLLPLNSQNRSLIRVDQTIQDTAAFKNNSCVAKLNGQVFTAAGSDKVCGTNGRHITGNIRITCKSPTGTPTPRPSGSVCPVPAKVTNIKVTCPNCTSANATTVNTQALQNFGSSPTPTPEPTSAAASPTPEVTQVVSTPTPTPQVVSGQ